MRVVRSLLLVVATLSPAACSSLNQGSLDGAPGDVGSEAALDAVDVVDVSSESIDVVDVPVVDVPDVPAVDVVDASAVDVLDVPDVPAVDVVDASALDVVDVPRVDVVDASALDVSDVPRVDVVDVPRVDVVADCGTGALNCSGTCVSNPQTDPNNCGGCGRVCALPRVSPNLCVAGACAVGGCTTTEFGDCDSRPENGCESSLVSNPSHCGGCGRACPMRANASATCSTGVCGFTCLAGFGDCDGVATNGCETAVNTVSRCGACGAVCPGRPNSTPQCVSGACRLACATGFGDCDGVATNGCEAPLSTDPANCGTCGRLCGGSTGCAAGACVPIPTPRQLSPLSTSTVTSQSPSLRWVNGPGATGAVIHLANNPSFTGEVMTAVPNGEVLYLNMLMPGTWYWYAQGISRTATNTGAQVSPVWQFIVGNRSAPVDSSFGTVSDFNRDGNGDFIAGAPDSSITGGSSGRARLYLGASGGIPRFATTLQAGGPETGSVVTNSYGGALASAGDTNGDGYPELLVFGQVASGGRVFVYSGTNTGIATTPMRVLSGGTGTVNFGRSVSSAGDVNGDGYADVIIGANDSAYVFLGSATGLVTTDPVPLTGLLGEDYGRSVSSAGDVNGDGFGDVLVGAPEGLGAGRFYLYLGRATVGIYPSPDVTYSAGVSASHFGWSVASAGDVDADGYGDVIVGAPDAGGTGTITVFRGSATSLRTAGAATFAGPVGDGHFGISVSGVGDADGDGYGDLLVGASANNTMAGAAYLLRTGGSLGSATSLTLDPSAMPPGLAARFGIAVSGIGDADHDGFMDFVVGARCAPTTPNCGSGLVYYFRGGRPPTAPHAAFFSTSDAPGSNFGAAVALRSPWWPTPPARRAK